MLPIAKCTDDYLHVLKDGKRHQTRDMDVEVRPGASFGEGFITITKVIADLDPLRAAPPKERTHPSAVRFHYRAEIKSDRNLSNCYALLSTITQGSIGIHLVPLGRLSNGQARTIEAKLHSKIDSVGSIHIFAEGSEIRSTQHPNAYDADTFYAGLIARSPGLSAAELLKLDDVYPHVLSRNGHLLASVRKRSAKKFLIVYDLVSMKLLSDIPITEADDQIHSLTWVSEHELAYVAEEDNMEDLRSEFNLHLLDVRTGESKKISDEVHEIITQVEDQPELLVLRGGRWGEMWYKYNIRTKKSSDVQEPSFGAYLFDRHGNARVRMRFEGDTRTYFCKPTPDARWQDIDDLVRQPNLRFGIKGPQFLDRVADVHSIGPDGDTIYISTRLESDRFEIAAFSMSKGVIQKPIAKHPRYDLSSSDGGMARLLFAERSMQMLGFVYEAQKPQVVWLDPRFAAAQRNIDASLPHHVNLPISWTEDGKTLIYLSTNDRDPGTYYVFRSHESQLIPVLELGAHLREKSLAQTTPIEFVARDGQKIPAYVTRPTGKSVGPAPLLVSIHGGPMARDSWHFDATNQFFASRGYIVLQVNYRGSSGYGAKFQNTGLRARLDTVVLDDIVDGVGYLIGTGEADPGRIAAVGASFGGWATYMCLIEHPEIFRAGISIAGVANWRKTLRDDRWRFNNRIAYTFWKSLLDRENFSAEEKHIDPYLRAAEIKQPIFIMHGERDTIVHPTESKLMLEALRKHNPNVQARSFPRATHTYWPVADRVVWLNEAALFLEQHLATSHDSAH